MSENIRKDADGVNEESQSNSREVISRLNQSLESVSQKYSDLLKSYNELHKEFSDVVFKHNQTRDIVRNIVSVPKGGVFRLETANRVCSIKMEDVHVIRPIEQ